MSASIARILSGNRCCLKQQYLRHLHDAISRHRNTHMSSIVRHCRRANSYVAKENFTESAPMSGSKCELPLHRTAVSSHCSVSPRPQDRLSDWEIDEMISRCLFVLDLKQKCYGSRFTPWPAGRGSSICKENVIERIASAELDMQNEELDRLIREILSRDDSVTSFHRAVQLMTAAFWDLRNESKTRYLPWTMTAPLFPYQVKKFGQPLPHYVLFYRIFMNVIGFTNELSFDETGIPKKIALIAKYRNVQALKRTVLRKQTNDCFSSAELADMKSRCHVLLTQPPDRIITRTSDHLWPMDIPLEERILSLKNPFADEHLHEMLIELLLKPDALTSLQRSVRYVFEMFWSREQLMQCYLPSTCNGLIRNSQLGRKPLPHHETFYSIFMQLFGFSDAESFKDSPEAARVFKFTLHVKQWERSSRLSKILQRDQIQNAS